MRVYLSVDLEGVAGVVHVDQTRRTGHDYERARRWMTAEANAAALGAFDAGATGVLINDSHGDMRNLVLEELDPRVEVISGSLKPLSMVEGVGGDFGCALFVGYHAGAGTRAGILDHTYYGRVVNRLRVGGRDWNEAALNGAVCGAHGIPVGLIAGDRTTCAQSARAARRPRGVPGQGRDHALRGALAPSRGGSPPHPRGGGLRGRRAAAGELTPFRPPPPHALEVDFVNSACADAAALVPGTRRTSGLTCAYAAPDAAAQMIQVILAWTMLAGTTIV